MPAVLEDFVTQVLMKYGTPESEARTTARILVTSDARGIASHGVARLSRYITGIQDGYIVPGVQMDVLEPVPSIAVIDAKNGLGQVAGELGIALAIEKAKKNGVGVVTIKNSNHYGIAGYYVLKALEHRLLAISLTNSAPLVVPTHGSEVMTGTNPIALGAPAQHHADFVLDMATSVVPRGKLEVYDRNKKQMPTGWAVDEQGYDSQNPGLVLKNMVERIGGGILPLGGRGEEFSGYKGYGLSLLVDILSGVLSGSAYGPNVHNLKREAKPDETVAPNVGHFFLVLDIARFMPLDVFEQRLDDYFDTIQQSRKALDQERIYIHGEKEYAISKIYNEVGIALADNVFKTLVKIGAEVGVSAPATVANPGSCGYGTEETV